MVDQEVIHKLRMLSGRQREILKLFCEGKTYKTIGEKLFIAQNTVKTHMANIYIKLGLHQLPSSARRMIIHQTYCPAVHEMDLIPQEEEPMELEPEEPESMEPEPVPDEVLEMVNQDEKALVVVEPIIVDIPPLEEEPKTKSKGEDKKYHQIKPKNGKKKNHFWRWILFFIIIALLVFDGMQIYSWASEFLTDVVQPIIAQNIPEQSQPQPQAQVVPTSTTRPLAPTSAPVQQVVVPTSTSQPTAPPQPASLFTDNFDGGLSSGWQVAYGNPLVVNGLLTTDSDTMLIVGDSSWRDYAVEYDASAGFCWLSRAENWVSVRAVDTDNNYAYKWAFCESFWYIVKNGKWNEVPQSGFNPGSEEHHFKIQAEGGNLTVYVDGMLMSSLYDTSFTQLGTPRKKKCKNTWRLLWKAGEG